MPLVLNEEQRLLRDTAREFLDGNAPVSALRKLRDAGDSLGYAPDLGGKRPFPADSTGWDVYFLRMIKATDSASSATARAFSVKTIPNMRIIRASEANCIARD